MRDKRFQYLSQLRCNMSIIQPICSRWLSKSQFHLVWVHHDFEWNSIYILCSIIPTNMRKKDLLHLKGLTFSAGYSVRQQHESCWACARVWVQIGQTEMAASAITYTAILSWKFEAKLTDKTKFTHKKINWINYHLTITWQLKWFFFWSSMVSWWNHVLKFWGFSSFKFFRISIFF